MPGDDQAPDGESGPAAGNQAGLPGGSGEDRSDRRVLRWHGRRRAQARAPAVLREVGLETALGPGATLTSDVVVAGPSPARGSSGFLNEHALLEMVAAVHQ